MAVVYLARQLDLDRLVALKELETFRARDPSFGQRFLRESRLAGSLSHPNIVTVFDYFEADGSPYISMELAERGSLRPGVGKLSLPQILGVFEGVLAALAHAEVRHVVHRDLKPENVMISGEGHIKIADFGIAKAYDQIAATTGDFMTSTGTTVGTPTYMAPEQAMGTNIGPWTDLYSAGVMAYELMVGRLPFPAAATPMAMLLHHINDAPPAPRSINPDLHPELERWILALLAKTPEERTGSAAEAWETLEEFALEELGPRWRRQARLSEAAPPDAPAKPLTPAPFESAPHESPGPIDVVPAVSESQFVTYHQPEPMRPAEVEAAGDPLVAPAEPEPVAATPREPVAAAPPEPVAAAPPPAPPDPAPAVLPPPEVEPEPEPVVVLPPEPRPAVTSPPPEPESAATTQDLPLAPTTQPQAVEPPPARPPSAPRGGAGRYVAGVAALVGVMAVAGFVLARSGSGEPAAGGGKRVSNDKLEVTLPRGSGGRAAPIPGLRLDHEIAAGLGSGASVRAGLTDGAGPTLLPASFRRRLGSQPAQDERVSLGALTGYRYSDLRVEGVDKPVTLYVAPATDGVATIACVQGFVGADKCGEVAASLKVAGDPVPLGPEKRYASALNKLLGSLDAERRSGRAELARAKTRRAQAQAAGKLAASYRAAAEQLRKTAAPREAREAHARLVAAVGVAAAAHARMATAARAGRSAAFSRAARRAAAAERAVNQAVASLAPLGYS